MQVATGGPDFPRQAAAQQEMAQDAAVDALLAAGGPSPSPLTASGLLKAHFPIALAASLPGDYDYGRAHKVMVRSNACCVSQWCACCVTLPRWHPPCQVAMPSDFANGHAKWLCKWPCQVT